MTTPQSKGLKRNRAALEEMDRLYDANAVISWSARVARPSNRVVRGRFDEGDPDRFKGAFDYQRTIPKE